MTRRKVWTGRINPVSWGVWNPRRITLNVAVEHDPSRLIEVVIDDPEQARAIGEALLMWADRERGVGL